MLPASEGATARCRAPDTSGLIEDLGCRLRSSSCFWLSALFRESPAQRRRARLPGAENRN